MGFGSSSHVSDRWETSALSLRLSIPDSIYGIKSSNPLPVLPFSWYTLSPESDLLASDDWNNAVAAFLCDRHFWTLFSNYRKSNFSSNYKRYYGFNL